MLATRSVAIVCLVIAAFPDKILGQTTDSPRDTGNGKVSFFAAPANEIVRLSTKLIVPARPAKPAKPPHGTVFLWPGLQSRPEDANFWPIGNGILQPVLTWGPSCAPGDRPNDENSWWISAQYVNTDGNYMGYQGCQGGPNLAVSQKDTLLIRMSLYHSIWTQTILDLNTNKSTGFHASLADQAQGVALFHIEPYDGGMTPNVEFNETSIEFARPHSENCKSDEKGHDDVVTARISVDNGQSCYVEKIILKGPDVPQPAKAHPAFH